jgi:hypothetical protein
MKRIIRLTESDLARIVRRVINEGTETTTMTPSETESIRLANGKKFQIRKNNPTSEIVKFKITPLKYKKDNKVIPGYLGLNITTDVPNLGAYFVWNCNDNKKFSTSVSRPTGQTQLEEFNEEYVIYEAKGGYEWGTPLQSGSVFSTYWTGTNFDDKDGTISSMITNYCPSVK